MKLKTVFIVLLSSMTFAHSTYLLAAHPSGITEKSIGNRDAEAWAKIAYESYVTKAVHSGQLDLADTHSVLSTIFYFAGGANVAKEKTQPRFGERVFDNALEYYLNSRSPVFRSLPYSDISTLLTKLCLREYQAYIKMRIKADPNHIEALGMADHNFSNAVTFAIEDLESGKSIPDVIAGIDEVIRQE